MCCILCNKSGAEDIFKVEIVNILQKKYEMHSKMLHTLYVIKLRAKTVWRISNEGMSSIAYSVESDKVRG